MMDVRTGSHLMWFSQAGPVLKEQFPQAEQLFVTHWLIKVCSIVFFYDLMIRPSSEWSRQAEHRPLLPSSGWNINDTSCNVVSTNITFDLFLNQCISLIWHFMQIFSTQLMCVCSAGPQVSWCRNICRLWSSSECLGATSSRRHCRLPVLVSLFDLVPAVRLGSWATCRCSVPVKSADNLCVWSYRFLHVLYFFFLRLSSCFTLSHIGAGAFTGFPLELLQTLGWALINVFTFIALMSSSCSKLAFVNLERYSGSVFSSAHSRSSRGDHF